MKSLIKKIALTMSTVILFTSCGSSNSTANNQKDDIQKTDLSISTYGKNLFLENVATAYMVENPNVNVQITTYNEDVSSEVTDAENSYLESSDNGSFEKYIKSTNTSLMSKDGTDIIAMDVLPLYKYADSGYLTDINTFISNDDSFNKDDYFNLFDKMEYNGSLYTIPIDFEGYIYSTITSENITGKVSDILTSGEKYVLENQNNGVYLYKDAYSLFKLLYEENYTDFLDLETKSVNFNSDEFINMLVNIKSLTENNILLKETDDNPYTYYLNYDSIWTQNLLMPYLGMDLGYGEYAVATDKNQNGYFMSPHSLSINANSENQEEAWKFIKFCLSEEMQNSPSVFPVNKRSLENSYKTEILMMLQEAESGGMPLTKSSEEIVEEYINKITNYGDSLSVYHFKDATIEQIIKNEVKSYFNNEQDEKVTANNIQEKVSTYLNE